MMSIQTCQCACCKDHQINGPGVFEGFRIPKSTDYPVEPCAKCADLESQLTAVTKERDAYKDALEKIGGVIERRDGMIWFHWNGSTAPDTNECRDIARTALGKIREEG